VNSKKQQTEKNNSMIKYSITLEELRELINAIDVGWLEDAELKTNRFRTIEKYEEASSTWSKIKPVYMRLQHNKCLYCEKELEGGEPARLEWDLEHFRPKGSVRIWSPTADPSSGMDYTGILLGDEREKGYYLLAYHLLNYGASCKTCNSSFKSNYFPIAASRLQGYDNPENYQAEQAYLPYPFDNTDDPEDIITFDGAIAKPKYTDSENQWKYRRACVTIDFLGLNRDDLIYLRAKYLRNILANIGDEVECNRLSSPEEPFTSCTKCFIASCKANPADIAHKKLLLDAIIFDYRQ
jgi:hypothetical protein